MTKLCSQEMFAELSKLDVVLFDGFARETDIYFRTEKADLGYRAAFFAPRQCANQKTLQNPNRDTLQD
jgi:hypothetical protein